MSRRTLCRVGTTQVYPGSEITSEQAEFGLAMEAYKRKSNRPYPDCREVLAVLLSLGYRKAPMEGACDGKGN